MLKKDILHNKTFLISSISILLLIVTSISYAWWIISSGNTNVLQ